MRSPPYVQTRTGPQLSLRSLGRASVALVLSLAALPAAAQNQLWIQQLGTSEWDYSYAAAPDGANGVYIGGVTQGSLGGPNSGSWDAWLARYDGAGNQLWIRQSGTSSNDGVVCSAPDGGGGVFVGGPTEGNLGRSNAGGSDVWLARYDAAGNRLWIQ